MSSVSNKTETAKTFLFHITLKPKKETQTKKAPGGLEPQISCLRDKRINYYATEPHKGEVSTH